MGEVRTQSWVGTAQLLERADDGEVAGRPEEYARSLRAIRLLGSTAIQEASPTVELLPHEQEAYFDFVSAVEENLATDSEYGESLYFNPMRPHDYIDGHVVDRTGRKMTDLVKNGWIASLEASVHTPEMGIQAERDEGDFIVASIVDNLEVGELYAVVAMDPKTALRRNPAYWQGRGYREGMAVLQVYYRESPEKLLAGTYAIKDSDLTTMRGELAKKSVAIPQGESEDRYIRYGVRQRMGSEDAQRFGDDFVRSYHEVRGNLRKMVSTTEVVRDNAPLVKTYFRRYITALAQAHVQGGTSPDLQDLASIMLGNKASYTPKEAKSLTRIASGFAPNEDDVRFFEDKIRYALVEELRTQIPRYIESRYTRTPTQGFVPSSNLGYIVHESMQTTALKIADNIKIGMDAERSYGGCASAGSSDKGALADMFSFGGEQDIFGGHGNKLPDDLYGSRYFQCPKKGCENIRPKNKLIPNCQKCGADVSCGPKQQKVEPQRGFKQQKSVPEENFKIFDFSKYQKKVPRKQANRERIAA